jgi:cytochrome c
MLLLFAQFGIASAEVPKLIPADHIRGKELYDMYCVACHGSTGLADTPLANTMHAPALAGKISADTENMVLLIQNGTGMMPAYEQLIDKRDSDRILSYLKRLDPITGIDPNPPVEESKNAESGTQKARKPVENIPKVLNSEKIEQQKIQKPSTSEDSMDAEEQEENTIEEQDND